MAWAQNSRFHSTLLFIFIAVLTFPFESQAIPLAPNFRTEDALLRALIGAGIGGSLLAVCVAMRMLFFIQQNTKRETLGFFCAVGLILIPVIVVVLIPLWYFVFIWFAVNFMESLWGFLLTVAWGIFCWILIEKILKMRRR